MPQAPQPKTRATEVEIPVSDVRLAIVGPTFFSYIQSIVEEFERRGVETFAFDEKHSNHPLAKIIYRLGLGHNRFSPLLKRLREMAEEIVALGCTDVLLTGIEVINRDFVARLSRAGVRVHLFMWDGAANKPRFLTFLDLLSGKSTFDPQDSSKYEITYIPLFAEATFDEERLKPTGDYDYDIGFCGTVHSSRTGILAQLLRMPWARGRKFGLMLYYHSRALFFIKSAVSWSAWRLAPLISSSPYSKAQIADMFVRSRFILDVPHPGQTGMTARTFEVLLSGSRLLTFNRGAAELLPPSLRTRVHIIDTIGQVADIDFDSCQRLPGLGQEERYFLSLKRFVDQLLEMMNIRPVEDGPMEIQSDVAARP